MDPQHPTSTQDQTQSQPQPQVQQQPQMPSQPPPQNNIGSTSSDSKGSSYFSKLFRGRLNRRNYLIGVVLIYAFILVASFILVFFFGYTPGEENMTGTELIFYLIVYAIVLFYGFSLGIRRFHDLGKSGWFVLLNLIPIVNIIVTIWLFVGAGQSVNNKYGNPPMPKIDIKDILGLA